MQTNDTVPTTYSHLALEGRLYDSVKNMINTRTVLEWQQTTYLAYTNSISKPTM